MLIDHAAAAPVQKKYVRRLKEIRSFEVAFVPRGANGWDFLVVKEDAAMPLPALDTIDKALQVLTEAKASMAGMAGTADASICAAVTKAALDLLGQTNGPTVEFVTELKTLNADLHTVATACADLGVVDALDGLVARTGALMKMAQASVEANKANVPAEPLPARTPGTAAAAATAEAPLITQPSQQALDAEISIKEPEDAIDAEGKPDVDGKTPGKPGTDKCGTSCNKEISAMANKQEPQAQTEVNKGDATQPLVMQPLVDLNAQTPPPAPTDKAGQAESPAGSGTSLIGVSASGGTGASGGVSTLPSTTAQVPPQVTSAADILGSLKSAISELLTPVIKSIADMKAEFDAKLVQVSKGLAGEAAVPAAATPGATATTPAPAAKPPETPAAGRPKVTWPSDFNEGKPVPQDTIND